MCVRILSIQVPAGEAGDYCNDYTAEAADMDAFMYKNPEALVIMAVGAAQFTCRKFTSTNSAYLLTGIRGVGTTSSARIIAKTVNCTDLKSDGEQIAPCLQCNNCISCAKQNHPDIIEIDAASRTGVDDIREIIESSEYKPLLGAYKFFIIDEIMFMIR